MEKQKFDLLIVTPLEEEARALLEVFPTVKNCSTSVRTRYVLDTGNPAISAIFVQQDAMGKTAAQNAIQEALNEYDIAAVVCVGIAGGLSGDLKLGDVCYSGTVGDVVDNSKTEDKAAGIRLKLSPTHYETPREVTSALGFLRIWPELGPVYAEWQKQQFEFEKMLLSGSQVVSGKSEFLEPPDTLNGFIVSGAVSGSKAYNDALRALDRKVLAIDTESGGVFEVAKRHNIAALTIRGISDYADKTKGKLESESKGLVRKIAARNAASFVKLQMHNPCFIDAVSRIKDDSRNGQEGQLSFRIADRQALPVLVAEAGDEVDAKLKELSPEFRLKPKGYKVPTPRLTAVEYDSVLGTSTSKDPVEVGSVLEERDMALVCLSRSYPDNSMPWILANELLTIQIGGKQPVPVVVDGERIRPPKGSLFDLSKKDLNYIVGVPGAQLVVIIENPPMQSPTRRSFLFEQLKSLSGAKFIFVTRGDLTLVLESEFATELSLGVFSLCEISFKDIAHFVEKNFSMSGSESEVVAIRLRDTFSQFNLSAHPTYFAGIPYETLAALLYANKRSELIQLAVDGFLTFVVADDKADVTLSRTTRARFLRSLAVELKIKKTTIDQAALIKFAKTFSVEFDFNIDPLQFINAFVEKGILYFDNEQVAFSYSFIESYLLAAELRENLDLALKYFDFSNEDFDLTTFDIYCELGPAAELIAKLYEIVQTQAAEFAVKQEHILLSSTLLPNIMSKPDRLGAMQHQLASAATAIRRGKSNVAEKQKLLDIADKIRKSATEKRRSVAKLPADRGPESAEEHRAERLRVGGQVWYLGTVMLGSGAEHMLAKTKQDLAAELVKLGSGVVHEWTLVNSSVDFEAVKRELQTEENLRDFSDGSKADLVTAKRLMGTLVDLLEFGFVSQPFRRVVAHLCEQARHKVLATSLEKISFSNEIEKVIHATWLADVDAKKGSSLLDLAIRSLPLAPFLRLNLASHLLTRVYWRHWMKDQKLALLQAAERVLQGLATGIDKSRLTRIIERDEKEKDEEGAEDSER
jgi:nucleoside phosphorylase